MIQKFAVLLRIENFQQRRGRVSLIAGANLVDLIDHDDRVGALAGLHHLDKLAGEGADVGAPVPLDLGFIANATHAEAVEVAANGARNGAAQRGFPNPGRTHKTEDGSGHRALEDADREELEYALLDVLKPIVVLVQNAPGARQIEVILCQNAPRQTGEPVEVGA